jgi:hypothetical protein
MTERNFVKELMYSRYIDMEDGNDSETICYHSLISIITELHNRIGALERELKYQKEYAMEQNERYD